VLLGDPGIQVFAVFRDGQIAFAGDQGRKPRLCCAQSGGSAATNDHSIAFLEEPFGKGQTNTRGAAGDEDFIVGQLHNVLIEGLFC